MSDPGIKAPSNSAVGWRGVVAFSMGLGMPLYLALNGGAYDVVARQEAAAVVWSGVTLALLAGVLPAVRVSRSAWHFLLPGAAFVVWSALSLTWTLDVEGTATEVARLMAYAGPLVLLTTFVGRDNWRLAALGLTAALFAVPILALTSRFAPDLFSSGSFVRSYEGERLGYPLEYWNALGTWAAMAVVAGLAWSITSRTGSTHIPAAFVPPAATCLFLTHSRGAVVAALVGIAVVCWLSSRRYRAILCLGILLTGSAFAVLVVSTLDVANDSFGSGGGLAALGVVGGSVLAAIGCVLLDRRPRGQSADWRVLAGIGAVFLGLGAAAVVGIGEDADLSDSNAPAPATAGLAEEGNASLTALEGPRAEIYGSAGRAFSSAPLLGIGSGTFRFWWSQDVPAEAPIRDAHSLYLEALAELGIVGTLILLAALGGLVRFGLSGRVDLRRAADRAASAAMVGCGVVFLAHATVDWLWEIPAVSVTGLAALVIAGASASARRRRTRRLSPVRLLLVCLAFLAVCSQIPGIVGTERLRASEAILALGFFDRAEELAREAETAQPWAAGPHAQLGLIALAEGKYEEAEDEAERAADLAPADWTHPFSLVRIRLEQGDRAGALVALAEAERLNPDISGEAERIREDLATGAFEEPN